MIIIYEMTLFVKNKKGFRLLNSEIGNDQEVKRMNITLGTVFVSLTRR